VHRMTGVGGESAYNSLLRSIIGLQHLCSDVSDKFVVTSSIVFTWLRWSGILLLKTVTYGGEWLQKQLG